LINVLVSAPWGAQVHLRVSRPVTDRLSPDLEDLLTGWSPGIAGKDVT